MGSEESKQPGAHEPTAVGTPHTPTKSDISLKSEAATKSATPPKAIVSYGSAPTSAAPPPPAGGETGSLLASASTASLSLSETSTPSFHTSSYRTDSGSEEFQFSESDGSIEHKNTGVERCSGHVRTKTPAAAHEDANAGLSGGSAPPVPTAAPPTRVGVLTEAVFLMVEMQKQLVDMHKKFLARLEALLVKIQIVASDTSEQTQG
ncbi:hypothetical protein LTR36_004573 [Oleoguttula mirabilis]|uniref:Uncharacterized protein n=1 Tax=Oleoguttula mirabilis TaxID=1507867 RepID=A0AAV9JFI7_9PEZI|nr:hypothetical protein LTR36_004573 [Oleoguttula mirabilis]